MKKITLWMIALFIGATSFAQEVTFTEDFDAEIPADWTVVTNSGDCTEWFNGADLPTGPDFDTPGAYFDDDACGNGAAASNTTLVSPVYDLSDGDGGVVTIAYDVAFQEVAAGETFIAEVNAGAGWELLATYDVDLAEITSESFDGAAVNDDFQVRFTYDDAGGTWGWHGAIDNFSLTYTQVLGVSDDTVEGFTFAPNPAQNIVTLNAPNTIGRVSLVNILGQTVVEREINATSSDLDVSSLAAGTYILKVAVGDEIGTYHLVKE